ncbi:MAG: pilus assembly PilX N-terminal domain-containing protein [Candidatus Hydrogenedentota bacterium]
MRYGCKQKREQQGFALVIALVYLLFLSMFATAFLRMVRMNMADAFNEEARIEATNMAQAGIEKAVAELRRDPSYRGEKDTPLEGGSFTVRVEPSAEAGRYRLVARGRGEAPQRRYAHAEITVELALYPDGTIASLHRREVHRW